MVGSRELRGRKTEMRGLALTLLFSLIVVHANSQTTLPTSQYLESANYALTGRIVNGTKAILRQFPHQVSLRRSWSNRHFCGGVVITPNHILTAAHCMFLNGNVIQPWTIVVIGGELKLNAATSTGQKRGVDEIHLHEEFDFPTLRNDIAMLVLKISFKMTPELKNVPFPTHPPIDNMVCQVAGWGYPAEDVPISSNDLMYVDLPIISRSQCRKLLENVTNLPPGMYCAGYVEGGRDACQGDSGGGMVCNNVLTGIVSGGEGCASPRLPGVYSDVYHYKNWIRKFGVKEFATAKKNSGGSKAALTSGFAALCLLLSFGPLRF